ncbi:MAG: type 1 glutamine amidotransferase [Aquificae bacterium]|nr:type 1 glutamine amidotransferase [Aquificota bacterium]
MKIHYIQHVPFETPANILNWAEEKGYPITGTHLYKKDLLPKPESFDFLVIMGGPMGVYDEKEYPWLTQEKKFIENTIKKGKKVLGICLGAQLIADVLGAKVYKNEYKEIGWFPVSQTPNAKDSVHFSKLPKEYIAFHWHGDTFEIPTGAVHTAKSSGCENQAFEYNNGKVIALQFHLETDINSAKALIENSKEELKQKGKYIQTPQEMISQREYFSKIKNLLYKLLDSIEKN